MQLAVEKCKPFIILSTYCSSARSTLDKFDTDQILHTIKKLHAAVDMRALEMEENVYVRSLLHLYTAFSKLDCLLQQYAPIVLSLTHVWHHIFVPVPNI